MICLMISITACANLPEFNRNTLDRYRPSQDAAEADESREEADEPVDAMLRIAVLDVGQGDATLIMTATGETILIDAGPPGAGRDVIIPFMESQGISTLTWIIATHYHSDHTGGIPEVLAGPDGIPDTDDDIVPLVAILDRGDSHDAESQNLYPLYTEAVGNMRNTAKPGDIIESGDLDMEIIAVNGELIDGTTIDLGDPPDENAASIAMILESGGFRMFIGGDLSGGGGTPPYDTPNIETPLVPLIGDIDILRVSHHGSRTSTNRAFLDATLPELAIISVGDENDYSHPHPSVIERLVDAGIEIHQTMEDGHVIVEVDGEGEYKIIVP